jgi:hypothetical protein
MPWRISISGFRTSERKRERRFRSLGARSRAKKPDSTPYSRAALPAAPLSGPAMLQNLCNLRLLDATRRITVWLEHAHERDHPVGTHVRGAPQGRAARTIAGLSRRDASLPHRALRGRARCRLRLGGAAGPAGHLPKLPEAVGATERVKIAKTAGSRLNCLRPTRPGET